MGKTGLFVSGDDLSEYLYKKLCRKSEVRPFSFMPVDFADSTVFTAGDLENLLEYFKREHISRLVFIGRISAESVFGGRLHGSARAFIGNDAPLHGERILCDLVSLLERKGIRVIPLTDVLSEELTREKVYTEASPGEGEMKDAVTGASLLNSILGYRAGQSVAVRDGVIIAVEGIEGTDAMIRRAGRYCDGFVLVKAAGRDKDERFDMPVIGPETVKNMAESGGRMITAEVGRTVIFDEEKTVSMCNDSGIVLTGVDMEKLPSRQKGNS